MSNINSSELTPAFSNNAPTMSSREIAELTGKEHKHVMRDIRVMLAEIYPEGGMPSFEHTHTDPQNGQSYPIFNLPKRETLILVSGYSVEMRARIIDRWQELESQVAQPQPKQFQIPQTLAEALRLAADIEEQRILAVKERDHAIATKAQISDKKTATAMATASNAVRKANYLEIQLDQSMAYATVKRMEALYPEKKFNWRFLKKHSDELKIPSVDVFDQNYGTVKGYHSQVWHAAYGVNVADA